MRKIKALSLGMTALITTAILPITAVAYEKGDVNHDGFIDANDASVVLQEYSILSTGGTGTISLADGDYNGDGLIDANDASEILAKYAELSTSSNNIPCAVTLKMDFTDGSDTANIFENEYIFSYRSPDSEEIEPAPEDIIKGLEKETGFSFSANIDSKDNGVHIDFKENSSLFKSNQASDHDEKYTFVSAPSKEWFILDTIAANMDRFGEKFNVYVSYCGRPIVLDEVFAFDGTDTRKPAGPITIPADEPYKGSSWYCAHVDNYLSESTVWYLGDWYINGEESLNMLRFEKSGKWALYDNQDNTGDGKLIIRGTYDDSNTYALRLYEDYYDDASLNTHALVGEAHQGQYGLTLFVDENYEHLPDYETQTVFFRKGEHGENIG